MNCPYCQGEGEIENRYGPGYITCEYCRGEGEVWPDDNRERAVDTVIEKLNTMPEYEFQKELDRHENGELTATFRESGMADAYCDNCGNPLSTGCRVACSVCGKLPGTSNPEPCPQCGGPLDRCFCPRCGYRGCA